MSRLVSNVAVMIGFNDLVGLVEDDSENKAEDLLETIGLWVSDIGGHQATKTKTNITLETINTF